jgi:hypothetical protein
LGRNFELFKGFERLKAVDAEDQLGRENRRSMLVNKCGSIIGVREALGVGVTFKVCFDEADKNTLYAHSNPIPSQSEQSDNNEQEIDDREKAQWNDVPELDPA